MYILVRENKCGYQFGIIYLINSIIRVKVIKLF